MDQDQLVRISILSLTKSLTYQQSDLCSRLLGLTFDFPTEEELEDDGDLSPEGELEDGEIEEGEIEEDEPDEEDKPVEKETAAGVGAARSGGIKVCGSYSLSLSTLANFMKRRTTRVGGIVSGYNDSNIMRTEPASNSSPTSSNQQETKNLPCARMGGSP